MTTLTYNISIALITFGVYAKLYKVYNIYSGNSPQLGACKSIIMYCETEIKAIVFGDMM